MKRKPKIPILEPQMEPYTARQLEILRLRSQGMTNRAIAKYLFISHKTVEAHIENAAQRFREFTGRAFEAEGPTPVELLLDLQRRDLDRMQQEDYAYWEAVA